MIQLIEVGKYFAGQTLFENVTLRLMNGHRYGLVGANGSGKSTLLKILMGLEETSAGRIEVRKNASIGFMRQYHGDDADHRVLDVAMAGDKDAFKAWAAQREINENPDSHGVKAEEIAEIQEEMMRTNAYALESKASQVLNGLGITEEEMHGKMSKLSGGYRLRVLLGQSLVQEPDILLLDEPTNHLDLLSIEWLEKFLINFSGVVVVVSHDQLFLEKSCDRILDVDYQTVLYYPCGYQKSLIKKEEERVRRQILIDAQKAERAVHQAFIDRFKAKASKAKQAQSRVKMMEKIVITELADSSRRKPNFKFPMKRQSGKDVLTLENIHKSYGPKKVLHGIDLEVKRNARIALVGKNGMGKSTLLSIAMQKNKPDQGTVTWGHETHVGYFEQDHSAVRNTPGSVLSWLQAKAPSLGETEIRGRLAAVLFQNDDVHKSLSALSGGEAARLLFAGLKLELPNVLLLDEPTNHLDMEAIEALVEGLKEYEGTILFVSHDRWFLEQLADEIILLDENGISPFEGALSRKADEVADTSTTDAKAAAKHKRAQSSKEDRAEQKKIQKEKRQLEKRRDTLYAKIEKLEVEIEELNTKMCADDFFQTTSTAEQQGLFEDKETLESELNITMELWEVAEEKLEKLADV